MYTPEKNQKLHTKLSTQTATQPSNADLFEGIETKAKAGKTIKLKPRQNLVDRQIVITGIDTQIDEVVDAVNAEFKGSGSRPKRYLGGKELLEYVIKIENCDGEIIIKPIKTKESTKNLVIRRYDLKIDDAQEHPKVQGEETEEDNQPYPEMRREETEEDIWKAIREVYRQAEQNGYIIFADPNSISIGSSNGTSGSVGGGPGGPPGGEPDEEDFWNHWCYRAPDIANNHIGINLEGDWALKGIKDNLIIPRLVSETGKEVDIVIFDTIPPKKPVDLVKNSASGLSLIKCGISSSESDVSFEPNEHLSDVSAHGVFVGSLLYRVAPDTSIYLNEVLDDRGRGNLFSLLQALHQLAKNMEGYGFKNLIVNLSLGVGISEDAMIEQQARDAMWSLFDATSNGAGFQTDDGFQERFVLLRDMVKDFQYIPSLRIVLQELYGKGVVIVAAAGNDSGDRQLHKTSQIPAHYPEVIGVAASDRNGDISYFSNYGDVKAPGGGADDQNYRRLIDLNKKWDEAPKKGPKPDFSDFSLVGWTPREYFPQREHWKNGKKDGMVDKETDFAYWRGTSFSTALVSGLVALMIEKMKRDKLLYNPMKVKKLIKDNLGTNGVIDVVKTINNIT